MRTTVDIPDSTYKKLKTKAAQEGGTVKELVLRGVKRILNENEEKSPKRKRLSLPLVHSSQPGKLVIDNERIYDLIGFP